MDDKLLIFMDTQTFVLIGATALGPGLFWLWYLYTKETLASEPLRLVIKMFFLGILVAIPVSVLNRAFLELTHSTFVLVVLIAPIVEETAKYLVVLLVIYKSVQFNKPLDGIMYAVAVGLGFATIENLGYVLDHLHVHFHEGQLKDTLAAVRLTHFHLPWWDTILPRALFTVPGHALWSAMWGYALGLAKFRPPQFRTRLITKGLLLAFLSHGLFNFTAIVGSVVAKELSLGDVQAEVLLAFLLGVFSIIMWRLLHRHVREDLRNSASQAAVPES